MTNMNNRIELTRMLLMDHDKDSSFSIVALYLLWPGNWIHKLFFFIESTEKRIPSDFDAISKTTEWKLACLNLMWLWHESQHRYTLLIINLRMQIHSAIAFDLVVSNVVCSRSVMNEFFSLSTVINRTYFVSRVLFWWRKKIKRYYLKL